MQIKYGEAYWKAFCKHVPHRLIPCTEPKHRSNFATPPFLVLIVAFTHSLALLPLVIRHVFVNYNPDLIKRAGANESINL